MDCNLIREELFAYHFGEATDEQRDRIDEHLLACADCLRTYLALKRRIEAGASERPSDAVRARLRANVEKKFRTTRRTKVAAIFQRRIPLYQGVVAVAVAALVTIALPSAYRAASTDRGKAGVTSEPNVDTARHASESLTIF